MNSFSSRHIGPDNTEKTAMLAAIGVQSVQELIDKTIPAHIRLDGELNIDPAMTEQEYLQHITVLGMQNANASLLDEATAAAEAMIMFYNSRSRQEVKDNQNKFFIAESAFQQTIEVVLGRALNLGIELVQGDAATFVNDGTYFGAVIQYPDTKGAITDVKGFISRNEGLRVAVAADILALVILQSPGSLGADVVFGSSQRFGVPMGAGGPHAAFFAAKDEYKRTMPGRIIGVSKDADDNLALRMALQTREQHIKRDKATSNICTAQALLAVMASMYAVYHGPARMKAIAEHVHSLAVKTAKGLKAAGITVAYDSFFDTVWVKGVNTASIKAAAEAKQLNFRIINDSELTISFGEPHTTADVATILSVFGANTTVSDEVESTIASTLLRTDAVFTHPTFNRHHSESKMMRYLKRLENKDLSLVHSMIPLGS